MCRRLSETARPLDPEYPMRANASSHSRSSCEGEQARPHVVIGLNAVLIAVTEGKPRVLTVFRPLRRFGGNEESQDLGQGLTDRDEALPFGPFDPESDRTMELGLRRWIREQAGLEVGYVEQLYTFGDRFRDPSERQGGPRVISVAYLALLREGPPAAAGAARWMDCYRYLPWEDWRQDAPPLLGATIVPALLAWARESPERSARTERRERIDITFGLGGTPWDGERTLDRYELLYEAGLVHESVRDRQVRLAKQEPPVSPASALGRPMPLDHRRILATALGRLRGKVRYRPVVFEMLPPVFTLLQLQHVLEALAGRRLHKQNLRRIVEKGGLVEGTGKLDTHTGGRPAELFRFRREVLRERPAPGVGLPALRAGM